MVLTLITSPCEAKHDEAGENVRRRNQAVRSSSTEAHSILEDNREEVCDGVGNGGGEHENGSEAPHLQIQSIRKVLPHVEFFRQGIVAILFNAGDNEVDFLLVEELLAHTRLVGKLREVDNEIPSNETDNDGDNTLEDEDPAPARETGTERHRSGWCSLGGTAVNTKPGSSLRIDQ